MASSQAFWLANRRVQSWRDDYTVRAIEFLTSVMDSSTWSRRVQAVKDKFEAEKHDWRQGDFTTRFAPRDLIDWYIFQANAYAKPEERHDWFEPEAFRITPIFHRIGELVPQLEQIDGVMDRIKAMMTTGQVKADDALFELLVAGAYKTRGWSDVRFHPESPGTKKSHDLFVGTGKNQWAVECKRINRSGAGYEAREYKDAQRLAAPVHELCSARERSLVVGVGYEVELSKVPDDYLVGKAHAFLREPSSFQWDDGISNGFVQDIDLRATLAVLESDDVFFGSSRMVELLLGDHTPDADYSVAAQWDPAPNRPLFATAMNQASVVCWMSLSKQAQLGKARHLKSVVADACEQIPEDCPAVVHVGYESFGGNAVDDVRHTLNHREMLTFDPKGKQLRWVYGNYMRPEHTNSSNESQAMSETTATYLIGEHSAQPPLPGHLLLQDDNGTPGAHW